MTRWLDEDEARAWRAFVLMKRALERGVDRQLTNESGLSSADYELLVPLSEAPDNALRARDLGRGIDWERSRLSHQLRRMEARGLIERRDCPTDARGTVIFLTAAGKKAIEEAAPAHVAWVREHFVDLLDRAELDLFAGISERVLSSLCQAGEPCQPDGCEG